MALINCPECGAEVSDKANNCPKCAFPISDANPSGIVRIKLSHLKPPSGLSGKQKVTMTADNQILWTGLAGQIAEVHFDRAKPVKIKYHLSAMHYGGECQGVIDPAKGKKYSVQVRQGMFKTILELQRVDLIDAE